MINANIHTKQLLTVVLSFYATYVSGYKTITHSQGHIPRSYDDSDLSQSFMTTELRLQNYFVFTYILNYFASIISLAYTEILPIHCCL
jgi:hypothetical protein